jgi:hypothetical protein
MQTGHCSQNYCLVLQQQQNKQIVIQYLRWLLRPVARMVADVFCPINL